MSPRAVDVLSLSLVLSLGSSGLVHGAVADRSSADSEPNPSDCAPRRLFDSNFLWPALSQAERCASSPLLSKTERARALRDAGRVRARLGDYAGAEQAFTKALALLPRDADISYRLAQVLRERPEDALPHAERAARSAKNLRLQASAQFLIGQILLDLGNKAGAQKSFERAYTLRGDLHALRAVVQLNRDRPEKAAEYASQAARAALAAPRWYRGAALRQSALTWLEIPDYRRAADGLNCALELEPDDLDALRTLARIKSQGSAGLKPCAFEEALREERTWTETAARQALDAELGDLDALRGLIAIRRAQGAPAETLALTVRFLAAVEDAPDYQWRDALIFAGQTFLALGEKELALSALTLDWELFPTRSVRALALEARTGPPRRERLESEVQTLRQKRIDVHLALAHARLELNDEAGALRNLRELLAVSSAP